MTNILLIEDNQDNADMTIRILKSEGYEVKHCLRAFDGAQAARAERPDVILMDYDLPDFDGRTMTLLLKKQLRPNPPSIIALTARTGINEMRLAEDYGFDGFISKPFLPDELLEIVKQVLTTLRAN